MKTPKASQPDSINNTVTDKSVNKPMNDPIENHAKASAHLNKDKHNDSDDFITEVLTTSNAIDYESLEDGFQSDIKDGIKEGLTPAHYQNIDEARIDEVLIEDTLGDDHYPTIKDIAADDAVEHSHEDDL